MTNISVQEMSKHFGLVRAAEDWAFEVPAGKITGFLSPTGGEDHHGADAARPGRTD